MFQLVTYGACISLLTLHSLTGKLKRDEIILLFMVSSMIESHGVYVELYHNLRLYYMCRSMHTDLLTNMQRVPRWCVNTWTLQGAVEYGLYTGSLFGEYESRYILPQFRCRVLINPS